MTLEERIKSEEVMLSMAKRTQRENYLKDFEQMYAKSVDYYERLVNDLKCLNEIAHIFLEHRAFGEYPSSADDMWEETIRVLDKYKIEIEGE